MNVQRRKTVIIVGAAILAVLLMLGSAASFVVYEEGYAVFPAAIRLSLSSFGVVVSLGAFIWLVYGYTRAFSSGLTRFICLFGITALTVADCANLVTSFMLFTRIPLTPFQEEIWLPHASHFVFLALTVIVLLVSSADTIENTARRVRSYARR